MLEPMFLWVTRTAPYHLLTAHRLKAIGHMSLALPVLDVRPVCRAEAEHRPDALAFTSANGVRNHEFRPGWRELPVFAVGDHSAEAARRTGYLNVRSAAGDVADLQKLIVTTLPRPASVVHFGASEPAGDLVGYLRQSGYEAKGVAVYDTVPVGDAELRTAWESLPILDGIVVHSPKGARQVARLIARHRWYGIVFCLSEACAAEFRHLPGLLVETAARPTEGSLISLLRLYRGRPISLRDRWTGALARTFDREAPVPPPASVANDNLAERGARRAPSHGGYPEEPDDPPPNAA